MKKLLFVIPFLLILIIAGCSNEGDVVTTESGIQYMEDTVGTGRVAKKGDFVQIHFKGWWIQDSTNLFIDWTDDSTRTTQTIGNSWAYNKPYKFILEEGGFVAGAVDGMEGMKVGGTRTIIIPAEKAYGQTGYGPIPPNADIKLVVSLLDVKDKIEAKMWNVDTTKYQTTVTGLKYIIIEPGTGPEVDSGDVVSIHYSGYLLNGKKFDSSVERDEPIEFNLGRGAVMPGWEEGILLLREGSKARLNIPPSIGFGDKPMGEIPPNSYLIFDMEVVKVQKTHAE